MSKAMEYYEMSVIGTCVIQFYMFIIFPFVYLYGQTLDDYIWRGYVYFPNEVALLSIVFVFTFAYSTIGLVLLRGSGDGGISV